MAIGAILKWAVTAHVSGINIQTAGTVLLVLGFVGLILSLIYTFAWTRRTTTATAYVPAEREYVPPEEQRTRRY
jgi:UPF0716 family protein affecting phage T7 exclusion